MMPFLIVSQVLVPAALLAWLGAGRPASRSDWLVRLVLAGAYLWLAASAGLWLALPRWALWVLLAGLLPAAVAGHFRIRASGWWPTCRWARVGLVARAATALVFVALAGVALRWRAEPGGAADLRIPLRAGTYYVANGGRSAMINAHQGIPDRALDRYRGQLHALDLVRVDGLGRRARGPRPADPAAYAIFGDTVLAPCAGRVVMAADGVPDLRPPAVDRDHMAGNHVILECGDLPAPNDTVWVLLGHLMNGSVAVAPGERIEAGTTVGRVGNSGNSDEPHLHIHAQEPGTPDNPLGGRPVPITLDGRYLSRNDRISGG